MKLFLTLGALFILMVIPMPTSASKLFNNFEVMFYFKMHALFQRCFYNIVYFLDDIAFESRFSENAVIFQLFEMFRSLMKFGDIEKNIPVMDPYIFNAKQARVHALVNW